MSETHDVTISPCPEPVIPPGVNKLKKPISDKKNAQLIEARKRAIIVRRERALVTQKGKLERVVDKLESKMPPQPEKKPKKKIVYVSDSSRSSGSEGQSSDESVQEIQYVKKKKSHKPPVAPLPIASPPPPPVVIPKPKPAAPIVDADTAKMLLAYRLRNQAIQQAQQSIFPGGFHGRY